jgi:cyclopropane fatty-acyl-phospholipid synthase-like methyltransferase
MATERYEDGGYITANPDWHDGDAPWKAKHIAALLRDFHPRPQSICDVGCGTGGVLAALSRSFPEAEAIGYEVSPQAIAFAEREHPDVHIRQGASDAISDRYDVLLAIDVFEHVEDYFGFLRSLLGKADKYVFHIPLDMNALNVVRGKPFMRDREGIGHLHYFSRDTALATLSDAGFNVLAERYTPTDIDSPRSAKAKAAVLPRKLAYRVNPHAAVRVLGGYSLLVLADAAPTVTASS